MKQDNYDEFDDEDYEDILDDFNEEEYTDDAFEALEYIHTCQLMTEKEIIDDIRLFLKTYHPEYKIVRRKEINN